MLSHVQASSIVQFIIVIVKKSLRLTLFDSWNGYNRKISIDSTQQFIALCELTTIFYGFLYHIFMIYQNMLINNTAEH